MVIIRWVTKHVPAAWLDKSSRKAHKVDINVFGE